MHPNPAFRDVQTGAALTLARGRSFGMLCVNGTAGPMLAHVPFLLSDDGAWADLHLVRSNPIACAPEGPAVIAVAGPDGYVSPDWYEVPDQVPTWNYVAVHLRGRLIPLPDAALRRLIDRQTAHFEGQLAPKPPWTSAKMTPDVLDRMMRQILPFRLMIEQVEATAKLNQNKPDAARLAAAEQIENSAIGVNTGDLANLMRDPSQVRDA